MNDQQFIDNIIRNLEKNGFPLKRVGLPLERLYEAAYEKGLNFNKILEALLTMGIDHEKTSNQVIFFSRPSTIDQANQSEEPTHNSERTDLKDEVIGNSSFDGGNFQKMMAQAQEMLSKMPPDQLAEMQRMLLKMSPQEKENLLKKGKEMGLMG